MLGHPVRTQCDEHRVLWSRSPIDLDPALSPLSGGTLGNFQTGRAIVSTDPQVKDCVDTTDLKKSIRPLSDGEKMLLGQGFAD